MKHFTVIRWTLRLVGFKSESLWSELRGMDILFGEATIKFVFASLLKRIYSKRKDFAALGSKFFAYRVALFPLRILMTTENSEDYWECWCYWKFWWLLRILMTIETSDDYWEFRWLMRILMTIDNSDDYWEFWWLLWILMTVENSDDYWESWWPLRIQMTNENSDDYW